MSRHQRLSHLALLQNQVTVFIQQVGITLRLPQSPLHLILIGCGLVGFAVVERRRFKKNISWATYYTIMEEDVRVLRDVSSRMINIFQKEGLVRTGEADSIEG